MRVEDSFLGKLSSTGKKKNKKKQKNEKNHLEFLTDIWMASKNTASPCSPCPCLFTQRGLLSPRLTTLIMINLFSTVLY